MAYCSNCGNEIPSDALYCPNCGNRVRIEQSTTTTPSIEMREALSRMSEEMEKAFNIAAKQIQEAFKTAKENVQKTVYKEPVVCPNCGEKNSASASYCSKCGKSLSDAQPAPEATKTS